MSAEKAQESLNVVNNDKSSNAEKNVKEYSTALNTNAKEIAIMENASHVRKNI